MIIKCIPQLNLENSVRPGRINFTSRKGASLLAGSLLVLKSMKILITGTSRGIGLELVRQALDRGDSVIAVARKPESSDGLTNLKNKFAEKLHLVTIDLKSDDAPQAIASIVGQDLDLLINNAGILLEGQSVDDFMESFRVNSVAPFLLTQALLPALKKSRRPRVIQMTSKMGSIADNKSGGHCVYRASKAALNMINQCISRDNPWLTSAVVHPGWVKTDMGGQGAPITPEDSAKGIWRLGLELQPAQSGKFFDFTGEELPW